MNQTGLVIFTAIFKAVLQKSALVLGAPKLNRLYALLRILGARLGDLGA